MAHNDHVEEPENCPGSKSEIAGKADTCQGCPNQRICSTAPKGPDPDLPLIEENLSDVKFKLLVLSGKGGVGKSTFSSQLAFWLSEQDDNTQVGILDVDICGPSIPIMTGCEGESLHVSKNGISPIYVRDNLAVMSVAFLLESEEKAVIWRGPRKNGLIKQFLKDVDWSSLDVLIVDTPPGTSDEHLTIVQALKGSCNTRTAAVIVTTPQEVSIQDVRKEVDFCRKVNVPILGVVENMSDFTCPKCHKSSSVFDKSAGGAQKMCQELSIPFLGTIPLDPTIGKCSDSGILFTNEAKLSLSAVSFQSIVTQIKEKVLAA